MSIVIADTNDSPLGIEYTPPGRETRYAYETKSPLATFRNAQSHPICGCCGANVTDNIDKFNQLGVGNMREYKYDGTTPIEKNYNRGILIMANPPKKQVVLTEDAPVDFVQCGEEVLAIRLRLSQTYVPWNTL